MVDQINRTLTTGRRKTAVALIQAKIGTGIISVNGKKLEQYFTHQTQQTDALSPLIALRTWTEYENISNKFDLNIKVQGGGLTGQAQAIRLGIARFLLAYNCELRANLRALGYLTRDPRMVERKKPGFVKARKRQQFKKR